MEEKSLKKENKVELSIILPVFNEGKNIANQISTIEKSVTFDHEVLIVYDFDRDDTVPPVLKLQKKYPNIKLVKNIYGKGVIKAVKTGFEKSRGETVVVMPADLADNPATINKMYKKMREGYDVVCATRYAKGGKKIGGGFTKTIFSRLAGLSTPLLLGIPTTDIANGFKMYKRKVLDTIRIQSDGGWEFSVELMIKSKQAGFKITEVPTTWLDRREGQSKFKLMRWLPKYLRWYLWGISRRFF